MNHLLGLNVANVQTFAQIVLNHFPFWTSRKPVKRPEPGRQSPSAENCLLLIETQGQVRARHENCTEKERAGLANVRQASPMFVLMNLFGTQAFNLRLNMPANPARPLPSSRKLEGSGVTAVPSIEKVSEFEPFSE